MNATAEHPLLRKRDGHPAHVTNEELFFDLVYVFAVTQISHGLLHHLTLQGLIESLILWFAVWLGWQYTCWTTNWFDPARPRIRGMMFVMMLVALFMAAALPQAFGERGLIFALAYVAIQVGRTAYIVAQLGADHPLAPNYRRMLGWLSFAALFWIGGAFAHHETRVALWLVAVLVEYVAPMTGFALPGMGRSRTSDWTIEGGHLAERCQLFVIVALGETLLVSGATLADAEVWNAAEVSALLATFLGTLAMWWLYFGASSKDATTAITASRDPGRMGAQFHYAHVILLAGIIGTAVGNDLALAEPHEHAGLAQALALTLGPAVYLLGSVVYKRVVYGAVPVSHLVGVVALALLVLLAGKVDLLTMTWASTAVMTVVGLAELRIGRRLPPPALGQG
ncbi:MAG: low temperature requirement protein A [Paracoccaceae bacterium]